MLNFIGKLRIKLIWYKLKAAKPKTRIHEIYFQKEKNGLATIKVFLPIRSYRCYNTKLTGLEVFYVAVSIARRTQGPRATNRVN